MSLPGSNPGFSAKLIRLVAQLGQGDRIRYTTPGKITVPALMVRKALIISQQLYFSVLVQW